MNKKGFVFLETIIILVLVTLSLTTMLSSYTLITSKSREKEFYDRVSDKYLLYTLSNLGTSDALNYRSLADQLIKDSSLNCSSYAHNATEYSDCLAQKMGVLKIDIIGKDCTRICGQAQTFQTAAKGIFCTFWGYPAGNTDINTSSVDKTTNDAKGNCTHVFNEIKLVKLYFVSDIAYTLKQKEATMLFNKDNGVIDYMKTLRKCYEDVYVVGRKEDGSECQLDEPGCMRVVLNKLPDESGANKCDNPVKYMIGVFERNFDYYYASIEI